MKVIYITGWLRSGSTILGNVLNELPGVLHAGEVHYLWKNGVLRHGTNSLCGCGEQVRQCPLWSSVVSTLDTPDLGRLATQMMTWQRRALRTRHTRARLAHTPDEVRAAVDRTVALYRALAERGAERAIVDSSKYPAEAAALLQRSDVDLRVVHIVRDPRATAYSYLRAKRYIDPMSPAASTSNWVGFNVASELVGNAANGRYLRVRHEDLTREPKRIVAEVLRFAGLDDESPVGDDGKVTLGVNHTVTGNPDRLSQGVVAIRPDERWRTELPLGHSAVSTALALPLLRRYRYPLLARGEPSWTSV
ncbi:sulfotransferase family protein [Rhizocola hellebori]|uniref:Sulfotransferase family protein n=1 Tax=Rhizocola hellebori TaxID=1392758 RepID=A0A8J3VKR8_9ACTN|nr:sulfotransferase [Rhizocola hellebori]GIH09807.1 sulfotransferase family protein [Rhizocola hellebori]